jgi:hypothetical protein
VEYRSKKIFFVTGVNATDRDCSFLAPENLAKIELWVKLIAVSKVNQLLMVDKD